MPLTASTGIQVRTSWPQLKSGSCQGGGAYTPPAGQGPWLRMARWGSGRATLYLHRASRGVAGDDRTARPGRGRP